MLISKYHLRNITHKSIKKFEFRAKISTRQTRQNIMHLRMKTDLVLKQYPHALWALLYWFTSKRFKLKIEDDNYIVLNCEHTLTNDNL